MTQQPAPQQPAPQHPAPQPPGPSALDHAKRIGAAILWSFLAGTGVVMMFSGEGLQYGALGALFGLYAVYLWRGGTFVIVLLPMWIWAPLAAIGAVRRLARRSHRSS
ncbi:hypothetical protein [Tenggerimyces flavus]|uniref:Uncharacterized protein n=1 Tax=Tenggerimyces flavus TaxID=1708749 RepID=A0ABV7YM60_9ACTN|nr:hypothetical protein [Tenggerimyces flavus]MBM7790445.1 hypothetical protein [Tenggerimyces flavus]